MRICKYGLHEIAASDKQCRECKVASFAKWRRENRSLYEKSRREWKINNPLYNIWFKMVQRCTNPELPNFMNYGGRGIKVAAEWTGEHGYEQFVKDMGNRPTPRHTIERKDNNGGYSSKNCVWATRKEQGRNKRNNSSVTLNGETLTYAEWAERCQISERTIRQRIVVSGWSPERAISSEMSLGGRPRRLVNVNGKMMTPKEASEITGISARLIAARLRNPNMPPEQILDKRDLRILHLKQNQPKPVR